MEIINGTEFVIDKPTAVTIGKFDGIHLGHKKLINNTVKYRKSGLSPVLFTFDISPLSFFGTNNKFIYTNTEKEMILSEYPFDYVIEYPFSKEMSCMEAEDFFKDIIIGRLNAKALIVGEDFCFGHNRRGNVTLLSELSEQYDIKLNVIKKECTDRYEIGSTLIREQITAGNLEGAAEMLGSPFFIYGKVIHGKQLGRTLNMPTINMAAEKCKIFPPNGVYTSFVIYDGIQYAGVTNIGKKPTVSGEDVIGIETFIMDFDKDLYGEDVVVKLLHFQRPETKFADISQLKEQMHKDKKDALEYIRRY